MSEPIYDKAKIWNERLKERLKDMNLSQKDFADLYKGKFGHNEKYGSASQADVSRWCHIGERDNKTGKNRNFPEYETMRNIADILGVTVAYLTGESDYESYDMEKTCEYTGLSSKAINSIKDITFGKSKTHFNYAFSDPHITSALELLLSNKYFVDYLNGICYLADITKTEKTPFNPKSFVKRNIPKEYRKEVIDYWYFLQDDALNYLDEATDCVNSEDTYPSDIIRAYAKLIDYAYNNYACPTFIEENDIKASKLHLQELQTKMIDELLQSDKIDQLFM